MTTPITNRAVAKLLEFFLSGRKASTRSAYVADLDRFAAFAKAGPMHGAGDLAARRRVAAVRMLLAGGPDAAHAMADRYRAGMRAACPASTANRRLSCLRSLADAARDTGVIGWKLRVRSLAAKKVKDTRGPGREAIRTMLEAARGQGGPAGYRDTVIIMLLYGLGLRRAEMVELDVENVDLRRPAVSVLGKGKDQRQWIEMPLRVSEAVSAWLAVREEADGPLFATCSRSMNGQRLTSKGLYYVIRRLGERAGVRATPHGLRHTAITDAIEMGHLLPDVQRSSRHADLRTLQDYYDQVQGVATDIARDIVRNL